MIFKKSLIVIAVFVICLLIVLIFPDSREVVRKIVISLIRNIF